MAGHHAVSYDRQMRERADDTLIKAGVIAAFVAGSALFPPSPRPVPTRRVLMRALAGTLIRFGAMEFARRGQQVMAPIEAVRSRLYDELGREPTAAEMREAFRAEHGWEPPLFDDDSPLTWPPARPRR
jgi:hypothetical protein